MSPTTATFAAQNETPCGSSPCATEGVSSPIVPPGQFFIVQTPVEAKRPAALVPLYASYFALQALDVHSTLWATGTHGEANPVVRGLLGRPAAFAAVKAASSLAVVLTTDRLRKRHPVAAVALMVAMNSAFAVIVAHNYAVGRR